MAKVHLRDVRKSYADLEVIHGVDIEVADGEFIVIVGPSGCGKSTLLRMVAGLEAITGGEIVIGDRVVNRLEPKDRDIAMVFQNYALYPHMSVFDNMAYGLRIRGLAKGDIAERVKRAADILELEDVGGALDALGDVALREAADPQSVRHVVEDAHVRIERVVLEHHGDVAVLGLQPIDDAIADDDLAAGDRLEA